MEVAIRQQIADAKRKEQQLYEREDSLRRLQLEQMTEFEEQKKTLIDERQWLESVREEVDSRMNKTPTNGGNTSNQRKETKRIERKDSFSDMPRQMPSEIDRQLRSQAEEEVKMQGGNRLLDVAALNHD